MTSSIKRNPEARREAIIAAARDLILEKDAASLTHRLVAERANVPLGSTTYYFASLDALRREALDRISQLIDAELERLGTELDTRELDGDMLAGMFAEYLARPDQIRADAVLLMAAIRDPALQPLALRWLDGLTAVLSRYVQPTIAEAVAAYWEGISLHTILGRPPASRTDIQRVLNALLISAMTTEPSHADRS